MTGKKLIKKLAKDINLKKIYQIVIKKEKQNDIKNLCN